MTTNLLKKNRKLIDDLKEIAKELPSAVTSFEENKDIANNLMELQNSLGRLFLKIDKMEKGGVING